MLPRLSPRLVKFGLLPIAVLAMIGLISLKQNPERHLDPKHRFGYEESDSLHMDSIRQISARTKAIDDIVEQLKEGRITLAEATQVYEDLNIHISGFIAERELRYGRTSSNISSSLMLLSRIRVYLSHDENLPAVAERLRDEFKETYGASVDEFTNLPVI